LDARAASPRLAIVVIGLLCAVLAGGAATGPAALARPADASTSGISRCPNANLMPEAGNTALIVHATLCLINAQRRAHGLVPLVADPRLDRSAQAHSDDMVEHGYFEHVSPTGSTPVSRMTSTGYLSGNDGYVVGENIAWGTLSLATPAGIVGAWMHSPGHRANILRAAFRQEGLGVSPGAPGRLGQGQPGATYTQDFGVIIGG
jgi:uncharacterized protein YkwD